MGSTGDSSVSTPDRFASFTLDPSHLFYVHPSNSSGSQLVPVPFDGHGFVLWRSSMLTSLSTENKLGLLEGRINQLSSNLPYCPYWERCNDMVKAWITNSISQDIATSVMCFRTAKEICSDINESAIMPMNPLPPISKAYSLLQQDENQRKTPSTIPNFSTDFASFSISSTPATANRTFTQKVNFDSRKNMPLISCKYCKKPSHRVDTCYRLHGFPADFKFTKNKNSASYVQTDIPHGLPSAPTSQ
ncbi:uncharacterized protein LOC142164012 [Nicotiana tabacum]|uniref:Uncharacterized protein LOC142164012 n=1 Tax=Nicotiana tabacum TaxID=4097 RepID=A0AC58RX23_TOBAC